MKLLAFLKTLRTTERPHFAAGCGTTIGHLNNCAYGYKPVGESLAIAIERESGGAVTVEEMRPDVDWAVIRGKPARSSKRQAVRPM